MMQIAARPAAGFLSSPPLRSALVLALDAGIVALSLYAAFALRFDGHLSLEWRSAFAAALPLLLALRLGGVLALRLHRWSFRMSGLAEAARLVAAACIGTMGFVAVHFFVRTVNLPRSVIALELCFSAALMGAYRFAPRVLAGWYREHQRARHAGAVRTLILGAGNAGDLLLRDLLRSNESRYHVLGFVDDDKAKLGTQRGGKPVLGTIADLPGLVEKHEISKVLIAIPHLEPERIRAILRLCERQKVSFKIIPASFAFLDEKISAAMLHDLSPEDLLPRDQVAFDQDEIHRLVSGRRVLVTGAGGSIGSEICRQVASHNPASLVLIDINENELYFLARQLQERHPGLVIHTLVADIREADRLQRIGQLHRPQYVFHAAAHKHVPLMEDAPEEAIKNNIFGTLNVAKMADACGAERFVLISTDKAVRPSSVMGASKRVAEMVVRDVASRSRTKFTAVRFGNVLGSAGSVVPLFKQQIQRGGPVTVTHPECTRYFMTIPEAVGLVVLSGLSGYGELCILDMGEPIRIAELASNMITMAGLVPGKDIPIVFTGLRQGEKLAEVLLSEDEEETQVRNRIKVAHSPPPPADLQERLERVRRAAQSGDALSVKLALRHLVPTYTPSNVPNLAVAPATVDTSLVPEFVTSTRSNQALALSGK